MARCYPRLGSCSRCGGTGRVYLRRVPGTSILIGDNTTDCPECHGLGTTAAEEKAKWDRLLIGIPLKPGEVE